MAFNRSQEFGLERTRELIYELKAWSFAIQNSHVNEGVDSDEVSELLDTLIDAADATQEMVE